MAYKNYYFRMHASLYTLNMHSIHVRYPYNTYRRRSSMLLLPPVPVPAPVGER
jgi:hypothetical protein